MALSISAVLPHSYSLCGAPPIIAAIDIAARQRKPFWPALSKTFRAANARIHGASNDQSRLRKKMWRPATG
ncbi:MAG: hypothetical protein DI616_14135 [Paracoccus denitrificans]|uniref:Uncharacterized protein n=1 Tax=Paracoccus denitrificans TaxID=266 RepID=A0A533I4R7_PARDE|nr:MAG: hypothetical protein DI616_14135 [Paracoccus denitrificans]